MTRAVTVSPAPVLVTEAVSVLCLLEEVEVISCFLVEVVEAEDDEEEISITVEEVDLSFLAVVFQLQHLHLSS